MLLLAASLGLAGCGSIPTSAPAGLRSVEQVRSSGSLRGTDLDGDWVVARLQTDRALLRRFDHLLTAVGEVGLVEMRAWIEREVTRQRDAATAGEVLAAWDEHLALLENRPSANQQAAGNPYPNREPAPTSRRARPEPAPRELLLPEPGSGTEPQARLQAQRIERFGAEAAERLRAEDAYRWAWAQRLADARSRVQGLDPAAQEAELATHFSGRDLLRARTLLGLPP